MQIPPRNGCIKQVAGILISNILQKWDRDDSAGIKKKKSKQVSSGVSTKRGSDICDKLFLQMNKKSVSSCEYNLTTSRNKTNKCLTAGVKRAFGCLPLLYLNFILSVSRGCSCRQNERGGQARTPVTGN